jgi:hypothetical protein
MSPIYKDKEVQKKRKGKENVFFFLDFLTVQDGADTFSRTVRKQLSYDTA